MTIPPTKKIIKDFIGTFCNQAVFPVMSLTTVQIADLIGKYLVDSLNAAEKQQLEEWIASSGSHREVFINATNTETTLENLKRFEQYDIDAITKKIRLLNEEILPVNRKEQSDNKPVLQIGRNWMKYAAAILLLIFSGYYLLREKNITQDNISTPLAGDIMPGADKAVLTLSNGAQIILDSTTGKSINERDFSITHEDGELRYQNEGSAVLNTMSTPKGGQYRLQLADGTKVWLNAMSSVTFPTAFNGDSRTISVKGEVYLEVAPDKQRPFIVHTRSDSVVVLGTSFNINSYPDEGQGKISLLTGKVRVNNIILAPGQALVGSKIVPTNLQQDIAWKNGLFDFNNADVPAVMRQLVRWYDVDIVYETKIPELQFTGNLQRKLTLSQVIRSLREVDINLELRGRTLYLTK